jgi:hypothetical protein
LDQADLLRRVLAALDGLRAPYLLVGAFASAVYGEPRLTLDIDVVLVLSLEQAEALCTAFQLDEFDVSLPAAEQAVRSRGQFNVIHPTSGNKVDFMISRDDPWGRSQLARRREVQVLPDRPAYVAAPEDVILGKLLYYAEGGSEKHLRDITGILRVSGELVDRAYVAHWAKQLHVEEVWRAVLERLGESPAG